MTENNRFVVDILFVLALFVVFAISALSLVTIGTDIYGKIVYDMDRDYEERTCSSYITEKIRRADSSLGIHVMDFSGTNALMLSSEYEGRAYDTYLYYYDEYLKEITLRHDSYAGEDLLNAGENIMPISDVNFELEKDDLIKVTYSSGDVTESFLISVR